jgi:hypothetical protein
MMFLGAGMLEGPWLVHYKLVPWLTVTGSVVIYLSLTSIALFRYPQSEHPYKELWRNKTKKMGD